MREIRFKVWDKLACIMHYNVESGIYEDPDEIIPFYKILEFADYETMQYTGMKDKNGKDIYEGDIFVHCKVFGVVKYGEYRNICDDVHGGHVGFYVDWENAKHKDITRVDLAYWIKVSEIVGNIHQNPELIEKE